MIALRVNGTAVEATPDPRTSLADLLREDLLLTGTHLGCEHGVCGACTLLLDGTPVRSCLTLAAGCGGADIRTIEGFDADPLMATIRAAFSRHHALQCGYCTPGMLVTAYDIVRRLPTADEKRIRLELAGNLCRCTGYQGIVEAIADVLQNPPPAPIQATQPKDPHPSFTAEGAAPPTEGAGRDVQGPTLSRTLTIPASADRLWPLLRNIETVAQLLPGATLTAQHGDEVEGTFTATLGPIRATFAGRATVTYDDVTHTGRVRGTGGDRLTRSTADGLLSFALQEAEANACLVCLTLTYRLTGPLAQFGRPAVVEGVMDHLLTRFATNLEATTLGHSIDTRPPGMLATLVALLHRLLTRR